MSEYEQELRDRLARGEPIETVWKWYLGCILQREPMNSSEFEYEFQKRCAMTFPLPEKEILEIMLQTPTRDVWTAQARAAPAPDTPIDMSQWSDIDVIAPFSFGLLVSDWGVVNPCFDNNHNNIAAELTRRAKAKRVTVGDYAFDFLDRHPGALKEWMQGYLASTQSMIRRMKH